MSGSHFPFHHGHAGHAHAHRGHGDAQAGGGGKGFAWRVALALLCVVIAAVIASVVQVHEGEAAVVTRFGEPVRVVLDPGLAWRLPAPIEATVPVDLRLHTTSSGLQDVGTRDGLRILVQAYVAWRVPDNAADVSHFVRAVRNQPDEAARQIRSLLGSALQTITSGFDLATLVNTDPNQVKIGAYEDELRRQIDAQLYATYGVHAVQVGLERLTLPAATLSATVERMRAERETVAAQRTAEGRLLAAQVRSDADRDARIAVADANAKAAGIEAQSRRDAAAIYGRSYAGNPQLYTMLRSLDTLSTVVNANTNLILRTDAAPFRVLVQGPPGLDAPGSGAAANARRAP
ncbi:membrane protease subunit HflC [Paraburkholderia caballeronis]|uniref:Protein HflC n=1 Tax=Paraburkholderia caballeronis TaxID=416943 RepID=A0A1H7F2V1_9BURK|nr:membrane protease subunit HflC [Paraburkholderia caballeronis]PXW99707.1 membrane protease subunit HflC [Paraburkholderia caballeronis]RAJ96661.1 membrane protease subunit HflC [Paraburkholderia caballeronis]SEE77800.1 membrane protease subunit HflC [Paraburkholderia caballeronis]SEK20429.1 membrane protease subunit HflC [Paraburkholderia caballeronis]